MHRDFIESYYETYNSEDEAALRAFYADDVVLTSAMGEQRGADAMIETYRFLTSCCRDQMTPLSIDIDGNQAIVVIRDVFTAKRDLDDFLGRPLRQGESFEMNLRGTYTLTDGKFSRIVIEAL